MADMKTEQRDYKGFVLSASAVPLGDGSGFNGAVVVTRHGARNTDDIRPNVKAWLHETQQEALEHGFLIGREWVDANS